MNWSQPLEQLAYLHTKPECHGEFRCQPEDFIVEEVLGFEPSTQGQHVCLFVEKRGENTQFVAKQIAQLAGRRVRDVSYGGLKDRHAVTRQWFSVEVPVKTEIDFSALDSDSIKVLKQIRHNKKLRIGSHKANRFVIVIRNISDMRAFAARRTLIESFGVPNYFGEQRFGNGGSNLFLAQRMFGGETIVDRKVRSLVISAARSWLFNLQLSQRIIRQRFAKPIDGDIFRLAGTRSFFSETIDEQILSRLAQNDIQIAVELPGEGELATGEAQLLKQQAIADYQAWAEGLAELRVKADCRPAALMPKDLVTEYLDEGSARVSFELPTGSFATAVLREWVILEDSNKKTSDRHEVIG